MRLKPFTPLHEYFPQRLVDQVAQAPPEVVCYCVHSLPDDEDPRFLFFIKLDYGRVQPMADSDHVPAEFSLQVANRQATGGLLLVTEFTPVVNPPYSCVVRSEFPWADPEAIESFQVLLEQPVWPFLFISEDGAYILTHRVYANPMTEQDLETCRQLIAENTELD